MFYLHSIPQDIVSDRGPQFTSCSVLLRAGSPSESILRVPSSNQWEDRADQPGVGGCSPLWGFIKPVLLELLSSPVSWIEYAHNSMTSSATGLLPFERLLGYHSLFLTITEGEHEITLVQHNLHYCQHLWRLIRAALREQNKQLADHHRIARPSYTPGQKVWLSTTNVPLRIESKKLAPRFIGSFDIVSMINPVTAELNKSENMKIHNVFHVSELKPVWSTPVEQSHSPVVDQLHRESAT